MRADKFFADKFGSRTKAAEAIEKGLILRNGKPLRAKDEVTEQDEVVFITATETFVSNGGYKLHKALTEFNYSCADKVFADIGASTGGFTDCLLQNGVKKVYTIDVGESLLHDSLVSEPRIVQMENTNARYLQSSDFNECIDGVVTDVSFISLRLIFPAIKQILSENGDAFVLIKPQFECENKNISKNGIVHPSAHAKIVEKVLGYAEENGLYPFAITNAPIRKNKNVEYVLWVKSSLNGCKSRQNILKEVQAFVDGGEWKR